jgi:hypothetical protein
LGKLSKIRGEGQSRTLLAKIELTGTETQLNTAETNEGLSNDNPSDNSGGHRALNQSLSLRQKDDNLAKDATVCRQVMDC